MLALHITGLYAALLIIIQVVLTFRVIGVRIRKGVVIGDGGEKTLHKRIRSHANFTETVPITLIALALLESQAIAAWLLHALGLALIIGRLLHPIGMENHAKLVFRRAGMIITFTAMITASLLLIAQFIKSL